MSMFRFDSHDKGPFGSFSRAIAALPCDMNAAQVRASFNDGVLQIRMPKTEEAKKKAITVTID